MATAREVIEERIDKQGKLVNYDNVPLRCICCPQSEIYNEYRYPFRLVGCRKYARVITYKMKDLCPECGCRDREEENTSETEEL